MTLTSPGASLPTRNDDSRSSEFETLIASMLPDQVLPTAIPSDALTAPLLTQTNSLPSFIEVQAEATATTTGTETWQQAANAPGMFVTPEAIPETTDKVPNHNEKTGDKLDDSRISAAEAEQQLADEKTPSSSPSELPTLATPSGQREPATQTSYTPQAHVFADHGEKLDMAATDQPTQARMLPGALEDAMQEASSVAALSTKSVAIGTTSNEELAVEPRRYSSGIGELATSSVARGARSIMNTAMLVSAPVDEVPTDVSRLLEVPANQMSMSVNAVPTEQQVTVAGYYPQATAIPAQAATVLDVPLASKPGVEAAAGVSALAVESAVARGAQTVPLHRQLAGPIASLATGPHGERTLSINVAPESLGPVTVKAFLGHEGLRVELSAPTEAGRDALRALLPDLRRDLATTGPGTLSLGTATESGTGSGNPNATDDQRFGSGTYPRTPKEQPPGELLAVLPVSDLASPAPNSTHLDVLA